MNIYTPNLPQFSKTAICCLSICCISSISASAQTLLGGFYGQNSIESISGVSLILDDTNVTYRLGSYANSDVNYGDTSFASPNAAPAPAFLLDNELTLTLTNNTGSDLELETLAFDYIRRFNGGGSNFEVFYQSGDLVGVTDNTSLWSVSGVTSSSVDFRDDSITLTGLADNTLANSESATFAFAISGGGGDTSGYDNIGFIGNLTVIPEPSAYALMAGLIGVMCIATRRRK